MTKKVGFTKKGGNQKNIKQFTHLPVRYICGFLFSPYVTKPLLLLTTPNTLFYNIRDTVFKRPKNVTSRKLTETDHRKMIHKKKKYKKALKN